MIAQITLTLGLYVLLARRKAADLRSGHLDRQSTALDSKAWPQSTVKVSNNIANQFESPILFYVLCLAFLALDAVSLTVLVLAWLFIGLRCVHAYIHTGSNYVPLRMKVFILGTAVLLVMATLLAYRVAALGA